MKILLPFCISALVIPYLLGPHGEVRAGVPLEGRAVLVRGTLSTPNAAERYYARSVTRRLSRWLSEMDIEHAVVDDETIEGGHARNPSVIILGYNPHPTEKERQALGSYVAGGGKLIVFYSADPELAKLLNMRLGSYKSAPKGGKWCAIRFNELAPPHVPPTVRQESRNVRLIHAVPRRSKVIAHWENASGKRSDDPAWVQSDRGLWMSHVLLDDGDSENKKQMLLALIAVHDPSVWESAAARHLDACVSLGRSRTLSGTVRSIMGRVRGTSRKQQVESILSEACTLYAHATRLLRKRQYPAVVEKSRAVRAAMVQAHSMAWEAKQGEFRGIWDHSGTGLYPGDWDRCCEIIARRGFTSILPNMLWPGVAHYKSDILSGSEAFRLYGDQLAQCVAAAHRRGVSVHAWKVCWKLGKAQARFAAQLEKEGRLQVSDSGQTLNWLCPSHPKNFRLESDAITELVRRYDVDGIHLDYNRFQNSHYCYCAGCRKRFEGDIGHRLDDWPAGARTGLLREKYNRWRCARITRFVRDVSITSRKLRPGIKISAAVFGKYPLCIESVAQDWATWLQSGHVDFVCPMNYTESLKQFTALTRSQVSLKGVGGKIFPGVGVTARESRLGPVEVIEQIDALRREGAAGFVLFELNRALEKEILPLLSTGITKVK